MSASVRSSNLLNEVFKYYNQKNYQSCITSCQELLNHSLIKAQLQAVTGLCFLQLADTDKAEFHLQKAFDLDPYLSYGLLGGAYVDLIKNRTHTALFKYTRLTNLQKENKRVQKILNFIKNQGSADSSAIILNENINLFIPKKLPLSSTGKRSFTEFFQRGPFAAFSFGFAFHKLTLAKAFIYLGGGLVLALGVYGYFSGHFSLLKSPSPPPTAAALKEDPLAGIYLFETNHQQRDFSTKEIADSFELMKKYIHTQRINEAIVLYNRLVDSNINLLLKEKFNLLYQHIPTPNFVTFENTYSLEDKIGNRHYRNTYLKLVGIVSKLKRFPNGETTFNFTLTDRRDLIRTVEVFFKKAENIYIDNNQHYQLLARYKGFNKEKKKAILHGLVLRKYQ